MNTKELEPNKLFKEIEHRNYGTEQWYGHPLVRQFLYTDGIKDFLTTFQCYWLLDNIASRTKDIVYNNKKENDLFNIVTIKAMNGKVDIEIKHDTYKKPFIKVHIAHSDLEDGLYETYLIASIREDNNFAYVWLLKSEY